MVGARRIAGLYPHQQWQMGHLGLPRFTNRLLTNESLPRLGVGIQLTSNGRLSWHIVGRS